MGFSNIFKYLSLAMEATEQAAIVLTKVNAAKDPNSPGGSKITDEEASALVESLDENFSTVVTRICQEAGLPIKSVTVTIDME